MSAFALLTMEANDDEQGEGWAQRGGGQARLLGSTRCRMAALGVDTERVLRRAQPGAIRRLHDDLLDRILIAQAASELLPLVTHDASLARYGDPVEVV